jgi:hypothetical protein
MALRVKAEGNHKGLAGEQKLVEHNRQNLTFISLVRAPKQFWLQLE